MVGSMFLLCRVTKEPTVHTSCIPESCQVTELCRRVELLLREARPQSVGTAASTSSSGASSHTSALAFLPSKDAPLSRHKAFTSMKAKQSSSPARTRMASLPCEPQKYQLNLEKDTCNTMCSAKPKSGSVHQGRCPPPVPPRKSIPEIVKEIKQVKQEIEQLTAEVSERKMSNNKTAIIYVFCKLYMYTWLMSGCTSSTFSEVPADDCLSTFYSTLYTCRQKGLLLWKQSLTTSHHCPLP